MGELYKRGRIWWADYVDRDGKRIRKSTKMKSIDNARDVLKAWELDERMIDLGVKFPTKAKEPLEAIFQAYESSLRAGGKSVQHVERTGQLIRALADFNEWKRLGQVSSDGITKYAENLMEKEGRSARTIGAMITAIRSFCRWCVSTGKMIGDPTRPVKKPSVKDDRKLERRMLLREEWAWLRRYLEESTQIRNGQSPAERLLMYRLAIETGLRSGELRSLIRSSLHLKGPEPHVLCKAKVTKNEKNAKQYVSDELAADLTKRVESKMANAKVFNVASRNEMARALRADVEAARRLWLESLSDEARAIADCDFLRSPNSQNEVIDFHALRHTCGSWLVMQGVTLVEVKEIMRHSTITLTVDCYGHLAPDARSKSRKILGGLL